MFKNPFAPAREAISERITIMCPPSLRDAAYKAAAAEEISIGAWMRRAIEEKLKEVEKNAN